MKHRNMAALVAAVATVATASCAHAGDAPAACGIDPIALIHREIAAGKASIAIPCDRYWLTPSDNAKCYLELKGLTDVTIDFGGSELIGTVKTSMLDLESCTNVTLKNVSIDYSDLPFTQARIEAVGHEGDTCQLMTFDGAVLPDAVITSIRAVGETTAEERELFESYRLWPGFAANTTRAYEVELDGDRELPPGSVVISNRRMGNGFSIRNCTMGHNRARGLLIKASNGVIESNLLERVECYAVQIAPEYEWMEGGCSKDVVVRGNTLVDNGGGVWLAGNNGARKPLPADSHRNIAITDNTISGSLNGIRVVGCTGLDLRGNAVTPSSHPNAVGIALSNVADVKR